MNNIKKWSLSAFLLCILSSVQAQNEIIRLWDTTPPDAIEDQSYREDTLYKGPKKTLPRLVKVTAPTLTVFRPTGAKNLRAAVIVCPGGGYSYLSYDNEGISVGQALAQLGFTAFVLKYRLPSEQIMKDKSVGPLTDVQRAVRLVRSKASKWGVGRNRIGVMGFSAGGHLAASASTLYDQKVYDTQGDTTSARPDFSVLGYAVLSLDNDKTHSGTRIQLIGGLKNEKNLVTRFSPVENIDSNTPPAFLFHAADDPAVRPSLSTLYAERLRANGQKAELHIFGSGKHGFGLGKTLRAGAWLGLFESWFAENFGE